MVSDKLLQSVERGRSGKNLGLNINMPRLSKYIHGIVKGRYYLIGADSGVGKTTYTDAMVLSAIEDAHANNTPLIILYFSFELSREMKYATWIQHIASKRFNKLLPPDYLMGRVRGKQLSDEDYNTFLECYKILQEEYLPYIILEDVPLTPSAILNRVVKVHENPEVGIVHRAESKDDKPGRILGFTPTQQWSEGFVIGVIDHLALGTPEKGENTKTMMDHASRTAVITRNLFDMSWVVVQQFNAEMSAANRSFKLKTKPEALIAPSRLDFGDSKYTFRDAEIVIGLVCPNQFDMKEYMIYDVTKIGDYLVIPHLMKNRYGPSHKVMPSFMDPLRRTFTDLPAKAEDSQMSVWYEEAQKLEQECQLFFPKQNEPQF